jgi:hypothetical protein
MTANSQTTAWRFLIARRTSVTDRVYTWMNDDTNLALAMLTVARINDSTGKWVTAATITEATGLSRSRVTKALKRYREITDGLATTPQPAGYVPSLRYSKVGNSFKYWVNPGSTDAN